MQIENIRISDLKPYPKNSRTHSQEQIKQIAKSMTEFGFTNPILIDKDNELIAGHGRLEAAKLNNLTTVPCVRLKHLTDKQKRAYVIADNKIALNSGWDLEILKSELDLLQADFEIADLGFSELDMGLFFQSDNNQESEPDSKGSNYTRKILLPIYEPVGLKPEISELVDSDKYDSMIAKINDSQVSDEDKIFLRVAAERHRVFTYKSIAEFYCHASKETQDLMEQSALVIIDIDKGIENGFVKMAKEIAEQYKNER